MNEKIAPACVSVLMPLYNEAATMHEVIATVLRQPCVLQLIVVDDCSTDGSWDRLRILSEHDSRIVVHRHALNQGKGAAIRTALGKASAPLILIQDADLEYDPNEYGALIAPILADRADVVFGSRFSGASAHPVLNYWQYVANKLLTGVSNVATGLNLSDMETCYKVFRREVIQHLSIEESRYGFEPEITAKIARRGLRIYEVPVCYQGRTYAQGKKIGWRDGFSALRCIVKYNFFS